jgi:hypothetical protein
MPRYSCGRHSRAVLCQHDVLIPLWSARPDQYGLQLFRETANTCVSKLLLAMDRPKSGNMLLRNTDVGGKICYAGTER